MEDLNAIAADCLVVSCCCQCLILQILILILLKLPCKLFRKTVSYAAKKLRNRRKRGKKKIALGQSTPRNRKRLHDSGSPFRVDEFESCMDEVDKVLEEFCLKGEFGFGRFWDGEEDDQVACNSSFPTTCLGEDHRLHLHIHQELDYDVFSYRLIQMFGSCKCTDQSLLVSSSSSSSSSLLTS